MVSPGNLSGFRVRHGLLLLSVFGQTQATPGWYAGAAQQSCDEACQAHSLVCSEAELYAHNADVDTTAELLSLISQVGGSTSDTNCSSTKGQQPATPRFNPLTCFHSSPDRDLSTFECDKGTTMEGQRRLCYCVEEAQAAYCTRGFSFRGACCAANCGQCGGRGCQNLPGGASQCCANEIIASGVYCSGSDDVGCAIPAPTVAPTPPPTPPPTAAPTEAPIVVTIGSSGSNIKCVDAGFNADCESDAGNKGKRVNQDANDDTFIISTSGTQVCAQRTDQSVGWCMDLAIQCSEAPTVAPTVVPTLAPTVAPTSLPTPSPLAGPTEAGTMFER